VEELAIDVSEMVAAHDGMRKEYASLPLLVKSVQDADSARAAIVCDHIALLNVLMTVHHDTEDELLWPLAQERAPEHEAVFIMEAEHLRLSESLERVAALSDAWRADPSATNRAALHTELIALEKILLSHLSHEEKEALPLLATVISDEEFARFGNNVRAALSPEQRTILLGLIVEDTTPALGASILESMTPEARANFEVEGRPLVREYKARLLGM
jgi:hemerythrin-like domain-containing protein